MANADTARLPPDSQPEHDADVAEMLSQAVLPRVRQLARAASAKQAAVRGARDRVANLHADLLEQAAATVRAAGQGRLACVRLHEAQKTVSEAADPALSGPGSGAAGPGEYLAMETAELQRNAARASAAFATLRVEALKREVEGAAPARERRALSCRLDLHVQRLASALASLEQQHQVLLLLSLAPTPALTASAPERGKSRSRTELEARWTNLSARLDKLCATRLQVPTTVAGPVNQCVRCITSTDMETYNPVRQFCSDIQGVCTLFE